jgi:hypothetical protein
MRFRFPPGDAPEFAFFRFLGPRHEMKAFDTQHLANSAAQNPPAFADNAASDDKKMTLLQTLFRSWNSHPLETVALASEKQPKKNRA